MLLFVGRIEPLKGVDTLIRAIAHMRTTGITDQYPHYLAIIGGDPDAKAREMNTEMARLQQLSHELGLQDLIVRSRNIGVRSGRDGPNPELVAAYRVQKMLKVALCVAQGALARTESRGAHFREDFPARNDAQWLKRTLATWRDPLATAPTLDYEALDVGSMELPPGWRGYGAKDYIDHPDTARRIAEVAALRERLGGADRFAVQQALMPYRHLLPEALQGRNERLDERFPS